MINTCTVFCKNLEHLVRFCKTLQNLRDIYKVARLSTNLQCSATFCEVLLMNTVICKRKEFSEEVTHDLMCNKSIFEGKIII